MKESLKDELLAALDHASRERWGPEHPLRARLQNATVTEPVPAEKIVLSETRVVTVAPGTLATFRRNTFGMWAFAGFNLKPPTDADLRGQLQASLPDGWGVHEINSNECDVQRISRDSSTIIAYPTYAALRKEGGVARVAQAIRVIAGMEE